MIEANQVAYVTNAIDLKKRLLTIEKLIGNTPFKQLNFDKVNLFVKLEYTNFTGSIKARPAFAILKYGLECGLIAENTTIVESSSGNFAIALATMCKIIGIKSTLVIDPNINADNELILDALADKVIKVDRRDITGGFLTTRINEVKKYCVLHPNAYWTNQYENEQNFLAYYHGLGQEICCELKHLNYVFIAVSSGGTLIGLSLKLKEKFPKIKVIAVDVIGSVVFGQAPRKRNISGLGSSIIPLNLKFAVIDEVIHITEHQIIAGCSELLKEHGVFGGGSTGAMYSAVKSYFKNKNLNNKPNVLFLCPDKGSTYIDTIYNDAWVDANISNLS
jgi:2,3-diaminopropionate biosynthesis protein SbnA